MIILSSLKLVFDTYVDASATSGIHKTITSISNIVDIVFNTIFALESVIKIIGSGFFMDKGSYLTEAWNMLDFFIVVASLVDMSV